MGAFRIAALASLAVLLLSTSDALAFRIIATSSGAAGIAQAPCCATGFDGGFDLATTAFESTMDGPVINIVTADGSRDFFIPHVAPGEFAHLDFSGAAHASFLDIGSRVTVDVTNWDSNFTGGSLEAFASARLEQVFTPLTSEDLYMRPVFSIDGSVSHAAGLTTTLRFIMNTAATGDVTLFLRDGGIAGTTEVISEMLIGPDLAVLGGGSVFMSLNLSTQVSGVPNDIPAGDHFGEADAFNTLTLVGFQTFSDPGYSVPINVDYMSDSGEVISTVPEPGTALLMGLGLAALGILARRR